MSGKGTKQAKLFKAIFEECEIVSVTTVAFEEMPALVCQLVLKKPGAKPQKIIVIISQKAAPDLYGQLEEGAS